MRANLSNLDAHSIAMNAQSINASRQSSTRSNNLNNWELLRQYIQRSFSSPALYRLAIKSVFTRWFAKRRTQQVFDLMAGFVNFQVLLTCVNSKVLELVYASPCGYDELSEHTKLPKQNLDRLILSAVALGLLERRGEDCFAIGPLGLPVVRYQGIQAMIAHNAVLYADMQNTVGLLSDTGSSQMNDYWPYAKLEETADLSSSLKNQASQDKAKQFARYSELMSASQNFVIDEILSVYDFSKHKSILDIGCGKGRFVSSLATIYSDLKFEWMDLPQVIGLTRQSLQEKDFFARLNFNPGSFKLDELPQGADLVSLVRVAHDHSDEVVEALLRKIYLNLPPGGKLLLAEPMADPQGAKHDAYFHFYLLAMGEGRLRSPETLTQMLKFAGFEQVKLLSNPMPIHTRVLVAQKT